MDATEDLLKISRQLGPSGMDILSCQRPAQRTYVQCALVLQYPRFAEKLGQALAALFTDAGLRQWCPHSGGLIIGQEVASGSARACCQACVQQAESRRYSWSAMAAEPWSCGADLSCGPITGAGGRDVWTTGGSTQEAIHVVQELAASGRGGSFDRSQRR